MSLRFIRPRWSHKNRFYVATTTRYGGVSQLPYASLNLGDHVGDRHDHVVSNRLAVARALALPGEPFWLDQVHGTHVAEYFESHGERPRADASICRRPYQVLAVLTADCLPLVIVDILMPCMALVHAGWRGLAAGILEHAVDAMGGRAKDKWVWLGPAIGPQSFEVKDDVWDRFVSADWQMAKCFSATGRQSFNADIYAIARNQLEQLGIHHISGGDYCTLQQSDLFYSHRRDGQTGRMATIAWMTAAD